MNIQKQHAPFITGTFIALVLIGIPLSAYVFRSVKPKSDENVPTSTLYLQPAQASVNKDDLLSLGVYLSTGSAPQSNHISRVKLTLNFDPTVLKLIDILPYDGEKSLLPYAKDGSKFISATSPYASITLVADKEEKLAVSGEGLIATVKFKAISTPNAPTRIKLNQSEITSASSDPQTNFLAAAQPAYITVGSGTDLLGISDLESKSASPSPIVQLITRITTPLPDSVMRTVRPTIKGTSFPNALVILSIDTDPVTSTNFYADVSGNWVYTLRNELKNNSVYRITVTGDNNTDIETTSSAFLVKTK